VNLKHRREEVVESAALELGARLRQYFGTRVLGPDKPSVARVMSLNIRKIVLKLENGLSGKQIRATLRYVQSQLLQDKRYATLQIFYDVDPL
jgi:primosomal protein N' (replication factor Y)